MLLPLGVGLIPGRAAGDAAGHGAYGGANGQTSAFGARREAVESRVKVT